MLLLLFDFYAIIISKYKLFRAYYICIFIMVCKIYVNDILVHWKYLGESNIVIHVIMTRSNYKSIQRSCARDNSVIFPRYR